MNDDTTKSVVKVMRILFFASWKSVSAEFKFKRELKVIVDFGSVHGFEVPAKAFECDHKQVG